MMARVGVDSRHLEPHIEKHNLFIHEITSMHAGISKDNPDSAKHLLDFLVHWLAHHILGTDQNLARQVRAIESGIQPDKAYETEERERDKATEPLVKALNGLFAQVSARNKELILLNRSLEDRVADRTIELSTANRQLEDLSLTDTLTGLPNRRQAMRRLATLWEAAIVDDLPLVCIMIDVDRFKEVNDTHGHDAGDAVLIALGKILQHSLRTDDIVCRLGGDEFCIICPDTDMSSGMHIAELTRKEVSGQTVHAGSISWQGSISVGVAARTSDMKNVEELLKEADESVYAAKKAGKNCVRTIRRGIPVTGEKEKRPLWV